MNKKIKLFKIFGFSASAVAIAAVAVLLANPQSPLKPEGQTEVFGLLSGQSAVKSLDQQAFGKLSMNFATGRGGGGGSTADSKTAAPQGYGGSETMPAFVNYRYVYKGEKFSVDQNQMEVFRRVSTPISAGSMASLLKSMNFGIIDMGSFSNMRLQNLNLVEDKDFGYNFYINLEDGSIFASENWLKWPTPDRQCRDQQCYESFRLNMQDIPDDQTLIGMADQFLKDHGIKAANYDAPVVDNAWRVDYENATDKANSYIPNILTVIYPLKVKDQAVYDEGGRKTGLTVSIDLLAKKVSGFSQLYALNFESSMYEMETDQAALIKIAEKGGPYGYSNPEQQGRTVEVELGTPQLVYVKMFQYPEKAGQAQELLVPSLVFPITKQPQGQMFYQKNIVVPLAKDILSQLSSPIKILPAQ